MAERAYRNLLDKCPERCNGLGDSLGPGSEL